MPREVMRVENKTRGSSGKTQDPELIHLLFCVFCLLSCVFLVPISYAQEENKDEITDLPSVKIEIVDTTQLNLPKEKFQSFARPDSGLYKPLNSKERPWYLPSISVPEKLREVPVEAEKDFLFSLAAHSGVPEVLAYQMLLVRGFGNSQALLNMGRSTPRKKRTAEGQGSSTIDEFEGAFAHQSGNFSLKTDLQYNAKELEYLDESGEVYPNDRSLAGLCVDWDQKLSDSVRSALNIGLSNLRMEGPLSSGSVSDETKHESALDLETDFGIRFLWPRSNPMDAGLGIGYFVGENDGGEFREAILRLYLRDNYIRIWSFVLGAGMELVMDTRKSSSGDWEPRMYPNPYMLLASQIGDRTVLQFGAEASTLKQGLKELYLNSDYVEFNPHLNVERAWNLNAALQYRLTRRFAVTVGAFGKEIRDLTVLVSTSSRRNKFEATSGKILSWEPNSWDKARIFGSSLGWELSLMDGKVKHSFEYIYESHGDQEIPYRPTDRGSLTIIYFAPFGLEPSLSGEFYGPRYHVDTSGESSPLSVYSLWKPRISKAFGKYASVFLAAEFYVGQDDYQVWKEYKLPYEIVDFGLTLKF